MSYGYILVSRDGSPIETLASGIRSLPYFESARNARLFANEPEVKVKKTLLGGWKSTFGDHLLDWEGREPEPVLNLN